ncbi:MAG: Na+/H+ antiporter NhaA [Bacteroidetes bacterium]|nr:Na+/H+ antiporter NhaA [Bacteroidota bacterium]
MKRISQVAASFFGSEKAGGVTLLLCAIVSLTVASSSFGTGYLHMWHIPVLTKPIEFWINDGLMTIFFLQVGLEIKNEIFEGELREMKKSLLPILAAVGGMVVPAGIHFAINNGTPSQNGYGIPMATDIAFSLGILSLLGKRVPLSLRVFLTALAIIDDLGAILIIALFYSTHFSLLYLALAFLIFGVMLLLSKMRVQWLWLYLLLGCIMWFCMHRSGIHATITGVLVAFAIPYRSFNEKSLSARLLHRLHMPVAFVILPLFALANTAISIPSSFASDLLSLNSLGVILGLTIGKPLGIFLFSIVGIALGWCLLPEGLASRHLFGAGLLAGIGFTMSIFITLLAFNEPMLIANSKIAVLVGSLISGVTGFVGLRIMLRKVNI